MKTKTILAGLLAALTMLSCTSSGKPESVRTAEALAKRLIPAQAGKIIFREVPADSSDTFTLRSEKGKIVVEANNAGTMAVGLNYYLSPEAAADKGLSLTDGRLYVDGVLRMVSRTDEEWAEGFAPFFTVESLEHFAWPGEAEERRRLFRLRKGQTA